MMTLEERHAAWKAQQQTTVKPTETHAGQVAGDVASAFQRFQASKSTGDLAGEWRTSKGGEFQRSLDGDTMEISRGKMRTSTRFAGIDAPESSQGLGPAAHAYLDGMVGDHGEIKVGSRHRDFYGRDVSILYAGDKNLNVELVRAGFAKVYDNPKYIGQLSKGMQKELTDAQDVAKKAGKGVWSPEYADDDPEAYRRALGRGNQAKGHDDRAPLDPSTMTIKESFAKFKGLDPALAEKSKKVQPYFDKFREDHEEQALTKRGISRKDQYVKEEGWLDHVFGALDYAGNVARSGIKGAIEGEGLGRIDKATQFMADAADKKRYTSSTNLRDTATEAAGVGKVRIGVDDGNFTIGDVGDFGLDLATDIFTDPLTLVSAGWGSVVKGGGRLAKALPGIHRGAIDAKLGLKTADAIRFARGQVATRAAIGAVYGVGSVDGDEDLGTKLLGAAVGAGIGVGSGRGLDKASAFFKTGFNQVSDMYAEGTRGSKFRDFSTSRDIFGKGMQRVTNIASWIQQGRFQALKELTDPVDKIRAAEMMQTLKTEFLRRRGVLESKVLMIDSKHPAYKRVMNNFNRRVEQSIERDFLPVLLQKEKKEVADAVVAWGRHNDTVINKLNTDVFGLSHGKPDLKTGRGIVGIKWHIDDVYEKSNFSKVQGAMQNLGIAKAESLDRSGAPIQMALKEYSKQTGRQLAPDQLEAAAKAGDKVAADVFARARDKSYALYAEKFSKSFLDDAEQTAMKFMMDYNATAAKQTGWRALETVLGGFDKVTNFAKANMLYFSLSWLKNNMADNMAKSFIESGTQGLLDAASFGALRKGVSHDVYSLVKNDVRGAHKSADLAEALERGVLDGGMLKTLADDGTKSFLQTPDQLKAARANDPMSLLKRGAEAWLSNPWMKAVGRIGGHMEGTARMMTYLRVKEALERSPMFKNAGPKELGKIKDMAADVVKRTFFDYSDVTHFEAAVFKRIVPFYSFYSKNLSYWLRAAYSPEQVGRFVALEKVRRNVGEDPSAHDKQGLSPYIQDSGARKLGRDEQGRMKYGIYPSGSMYDAAKMLDVKGGVERVLQGKVPKQLLDKGHTFPKAAYELATGNDLFDDQELYPSRSKDGKKFLFSRGHKYSAIGLAEVDESGNPFTTSDKLVTFDKILSTLWPHGLVDQIAGSAGKVASGKETLGEAISNRLSPMQTVKVSESYARMVRQKKKEDRDGKED